eukprot:COSAG02_NODE_13296_length_1413_cov_1.444444_1_plen_257_part_00
MSNRTGASRKLNGGLQHSYMVARTAAVASRRWALALMTCCALLEITEVAGKSGWFRRRRSASDDDSDSFFSSSRRRSSTTCVGEACHAWDWCTLDCSCVMRVVSASMGCHTFYFWMMMLVLTCLLICGCKVLCEVRGPGLCNECTAYCRRNAPRPQRRKTTPAVSTIDPVQSESQGFRVSEIMRAVDGGGGGDGGSLLRASFNIDDQTVPSRDPRLAPTSSGKIRVSNPLTSLRSSIVSRASTQSNSDLTQTLSHE